MLTFPTRVKTVLSSQGLAVFVSLVLILAQGIQAREGRTYRNSHNNNNNNDNNNHIMSVLTSEQREQFAKNSAKFAINVYGLLSKDKPNENIVFSPFSIQTCAAMARIGAEGQTADELDRGLGLISNDVTTIANTFNSVLASYENSNVLKIANKIYVMKGYHIRSEFNEIVTKKFYSGAEEIDFAQNVQAAENINQWVEARTNNLIKKLVQPDALDGSTRLVLLNAIHFKGEWQHKFNKRDTRDDDFYLNESDSVRVPMMNLKERFRYAELPELDATAIELPYKDTDLSMLVILPNSRTGLAGLEEKLAGVALSDITSKMYSTQVIVKFPKFKAEFSMELNEPMQKLGMSRMFSGNAEFGKMLEESEPLQVSKVIHKAFIDVNEEGTEAAAATAILVRKKRSMGAPEPEPKELIADHPFFYVIHAPKTASAPGDGSDSHNTVLFVGSLRSRVVGIEESTSPPTQRDEL